MRRSVQYILLILFICEYVESKSHGSLTPLTHSISQEGDKILISFRKPDSRCPLRYHTSTTCSCKTISTTTTTATTPETTTPSMTTEMDTTTWASTTTTDAYTETTTLSRTTKYDDTTTTTNSYADTTTFGTTTTTTFRATLTKITTSAPTIRPLTAKSNDAAAATTKKYKFTKTIPAANTTTIYESVATAAALSIANKLYCEPSLCNWYNGNAKAWVEVPHIGCQNNGTFENTCGKQPHLLYMNERRRNLILNMHNLARSRIASGQLLGFKPATHMPLLKWDNELEFLATLHVKRCRFAHDQCRNTQKYRFSGQNIAYYWISRDFRSHSRRIKSFIVDWFREYRHANQSFIDNFQLHPDKK